MIEFAIGVIVGILAMALVEDKRREAMQPRPQQPTEEDIRKAKQMAREYANFMTYDGTEQEEFNS